MKQVYEFLEVSAPEAERAWRVYCDWRDVVASALVYFIPTSGGSFVVAQATRPQHWWSHFLDPHKFHEPDLEGFRDFLAEAWPR